MQYSPIFARRLRQSLSALLLPLLLLSLFGCSTLRNVPKEESLLDEVRIETIDAPSDISDAELKRYLRQIPNSRILGRRFHLWLYNLGKPGVETGMNGWFHRIGEAPVIYSRKLTNLGVDNLTTYLHSRGYFECLVYDSVYDRRKRRKGVCYTVDFGRPTRLAQVQIDMPDSIAKTYLMRKWADWGLKTGERLDDKRLNETRANVARILRNEGYFNFSPEYVNFLADTLTHPRLADLKVQIPSSTRKDIPPALFHRYVLDSLRVFTRYNPLAPLTTDMHRLQSATSDGIHYYFPTSPGIRYRVLDRMILVRPDSLVRLDLVNRSQQNILSAGLYQLATFDFTSGGAPRDTVIDRTPQRIYPLNAALNLTRFKTQSYQFEAMLTTSGSIGTEGSYTYRHRNLFNGAEQLEVQLRLQVEALRNRKELDFKTAIELGTRVSLTYPGFLIPFLKNTYLRRISPRTRFQVAYNYQRRPDYTRTIASGSTLYTWQQGGRISHSFSPIEVNVVKIFSITESFSDRIAQTYLANSYISQLVGLTSYSFAYASRPSPQHPSNHTLRWNAELAGNGMWSLRKLLCTERPDGVHELLGLPFAQYARGDVNYAYHWVVDRNNTLAFRTYLGLGYPYGNSTALPFEKRFFEGGANGVRAWHARDLGPGAYNERKLKYPNQTGDIKMELNAEYRYKMFWRLEGALFMDAGNIWAISAADERPGAQFHFDSFYRQIALGYGTGLRLNLGFFILRMDLGVKLYDPAIGVDPEHPDAHWIPFQRDYSERDFVMHVGVGYPF